MDSTGKNTRCVCVSVYERVWACVRESVYLWRFCVEKRLNMYYSTVRCLRAFHWETLQEPLVHWLGPSTFLFDVIFPLSNYMRVLSLGPFISIILVFFRFTWDCTKNALYLLILQSSKHRKVNMFGNCLHLSFEEWIKRSVNYIRYATNFSIQQTFIHIYLSIFSFSFSFCLSIPPVAFKERPYC